MIRATLHDQLRCHFPSALWRGRRDQREIALTFDDGPHNVETLPLLAALADYEIRATFFHIGVRVMAQPDLARAVASAGHQVGIHGFRHRSFVLQRTVSLRQQLAQAQALLAASTGQDAAIIRNVRPPYGHFTPAILRRWVAWGYRPVMWTVVPFHWLQSAQDTVQQILREVGNGSILVLHEGLRGPPVVNLVRAVLPPLINAGYRFITIDEMWQGLTKNDQISKAE